MMDLKTTALALGLLLSLSGCLGGDEALDPGGADDVQGTDQANGTAGPWTITAHAEPYIGQGVGNPYWTISVSEGCNFFNLDVPPDSTSLAITLISPDGNATGAGEQTATFLTRPASGSWQGFYLADRQETDVAPPPRDHWAIEIEDPGPGAWDIWIWPHGVVADLTLDLRVVVDGMGPTPTEALELSGDNTYC